MNKYASLLVFFVVTMAAASVGSIVIPGPWYEALAKPSWTPPNWLFAPTWFVLYFMIAIAGWLAWRTQGRGPALPFWIAQLALNAAWSYIMFGRHEIGLAMLDLVALWLMIVGFILTVWQSSRLASLLFLPYLAWVTFAGALNYAVWHMNPGG